MDQTLELFTSDELIDELAKRQTVAGIIIKPDGEVKEYFDASDFEIRTKFQTLLEFNKGKN